MKTTTLDQLKCYVNLDTFAEDSLNAWRQTTHNLGNRIRIRYEIKELVKSTRRARWAVEPDAGNIAIPSGPDASLVKAATNARTFTTPPPDSRQVRGVTNTLCLPDVGGNKYTVRCVKERTLAKDAQIVREYVTWRRLWYSLFYSDDEQHPLISGIQTALQRAYRGVHIDLQPSGRPTKLADGPELGILENLHHTGAAPRTSYLKHLMGGRWPALAYDPFHFAIGLFKQLTAVDSFTATKVIDTSRWGSFQEIEAGRYLADDGSAALEKVGRYWTIYFKLAGGFLRTMTAAAASQLQRGLGRRTRPGVSELVLDFSIDGAQVQRTGFSNHSPTVFKIDLSRPALRSYSQKIDAGGISLSVQIQVLDYGRLGFACGNLLFIETHNYDLTGAPIDDCIVNRADREVWDMKGAEELEMIVVHEVGHVLGMVADDHPRLYRLRGPHCGHNAVNDPPRYPPERADLPLCVMYHQLHDQARPQFCADCSESLGRVALRSADLNAKQSWTHQAKDRL